MKKILLVIIVIFVLLNFSACSNSRGVSETQIEKDINQLEILQEGFVSNNYTQSVPYSVNTFEITKRQTNPDEKNDIIYCNVSISNKFYKSDFSCILTYEFYDKGGWILEDYEFTEVVTIPIASIEKSNVPQIRVVAQNNTYTLTSNDIQDISFIDNDVPCSRITYIYNDGMISFKGILDCKFADNGWYFPTKNAAKEFQLIDYSVDWNSEKVCRSFSTADEWLTISPKTMYKYYKTQEDYKKGKHIYTGRNNVRVSFNIISVEGNVISGEYSITAMDDSAMMGNESYATIKHNISSSFETTLIDATNGIFEITFTTDLFSYHYKGSGFINPCYTSADIKLKAVYNFQKSRWDVSLNIEDLNLDDNAIIETF